MVEWRHRPNGHEFEQTPGDGEGQGGLACCSPQGCKESDTTEGLNSNNKFICQNHPKKHHKLGDLKQQKLLVSKF